MPVQAEPCRSVETRLPFAPIFDPDHIEWAQEKRVGVSISDPADRLNQQEADRREFSYERVVEDEVPMPVVRKPEEDVPALGRGIREPQTAM